MIRKLLQSLQRIETMYDLKSITEEQYAMMELMNDRLAPCIPKEKCRDYVTEAIACGQEAFEQYKDADIMAILVNSGVAILQDEREFTHHGQNYEVWAQITCGGKEKKIELFIHPKDYSKAVGQKKSNLQFFTSMGYHIEIKTKETIQRNRFLLAYADKEQKGVEVCG